MVNLFPNPIAVGFYSIAAGVTERLWSASKTTSVVLLPKIAAEKDERVSKGFTPIVSRIVLLITIIGALVLFFLTTPLIILLYNVFICGSPIADFTTGNSSPQRFANFG